VHVTIKVSQTGLLVLDSEGLMIIRWTNTINYNRLYRVNGVYKSLVVQDSRRERCVVPWSDSHVSCCIKTGCGPADDFLLVVLSALML